MPEPEHTPIGAGLRLGIDVGGTNTDAAVMRGDEILARGKTPTTPDITTGVATVIRDLLAAGDLPREDITHAMLGTTHATNAILQRRNLDRVAVVRIGSPATHGIPICYGWPEDLRREVLLGETIVRGGFEFNGRAIVPFEPDEVRAFLDDLDETPDAVAVTGVFSPISPEQELAVAELVRHRFGDLPISLSHELGGIGLIERENTTILNAALQRAARQALVGFEAALAGNGLRPTPLFAQNDGTLMAIEQALRLPILSIGSGPSNSIRGATHLSRMASGIVADVGGTTTDIGVVVNGLPRESYAGRIVGDVATNFRMPDIVTVAIGGGTVIRRTDAGVRLGPDSVGHELWRRALVFGGDVPTLTDAAVHAGRMSVGDPSLLAGHEDLLEAAIVASDEALTIAIESVKSSRAEEDFVVVGGGRDLFPDRIPGVRRVPAPAHADVANAAGAASADIGADAEMIIALDETRDASFDQIRREATDRAIAAGADPGRIEVVDVAEVPLAYLNPPAARLRIRVSGALVPRPTGIPGHAPATTPEGVQHV